jgi:phage recombination protein Bet
VTDTQTTTQELTVQTQERGEIRLAGPRLPYHPAIEERFGIDRATWKVLTDVLFPAAEAPESIIMAVSYCKARKLDIMKKPVHIVPVWDKKRSKMVDSVWPSIAEVRITAMRTGQYAGNDETVFGPDKTVTLAGVEVTFPEWAQFTVYRMVGGARCAFVGPKVRWTEFYAKAKRDTIAPNDMWRTKPYSQLEKCAEAGALRRAFPEEVGNDPTAEEMEGQEVTHIVQPEAMTSGVMGRLTAQGEASGGFNDADIDSAVNGDEKPKRQRRKKGDEPSQAAVIEPEVDPTADISPIGGGEVVDTETGEIIQEGVSAEEAIDAEVEDIKTAEPETPTETAAEEPAEALDPEEEPEVVSEGYPAADEVYFLTGDGYNANDRRETYKNGAPFSTAKRGAAIKVYEDHPPEGPGGSTVPEQEEPATGGGLLDGFKTLTAWVGDGGMKAAAAALFKTPQFDEAPEEIREEIRAFIYKEVLRINAEHGAKVDPGEDATAFSLLISYETDPDAITGTFEVLKRSPAWQKVKPEGQAKVEARVAAKVQALKAGA